MASAQHKALIRDNIRRAEEKWWDISARYAGGRVDKRVPERERPASWRRRERAKEKLRSLYSRDYGAPKR